MSGMYLVDEFGISITGTNPLATKQLLYDPNTLTWGSQRNITGTSGIPATPYSGSAPYYINSAATVNVKGSRGVIGTIVNASNTTTGIITVYDSLTGSGSLIWSGTLNAGQVVPLGLPTFVGITVVTAGAQAIVVTYS